jgi:hypothetical protein
VLPFSPPAAGVEIRGLMSFPEEPTNYSPFGHWKCIIKELKTSYGDQRLVLLRDSVTFSEKKL